jgi:hypothetical protein
MPLVKTGYAIVLTLFLGGCATTTDRPAENYQRVVHPNE